jgi:hypothetical protein
LANEPTGSGQYRSRFRKWPRIEIDGSLRAVDLTSNAPATIRNISRGGFQTLSEVAVPVGSEREFRVELPKNQRYDVRASAAYCQPVADGSRLFAIGWQAAQDEANLARLAELIDEMTTLPADTTA